MAILRCEALVEIVDKVRNIIPTLVDEEETRFLTHCAAAVMELHETVCLRVQRIVAVTSKGGGANHVKYRSLPTPNASTGTNAWSKKSSLLS